MKKNISLLFVNFCICFSFLNAGVLDHLKKAEGKSTGHSIENVDYIYMINLDQRPEKWQKSLDQLSPYGIIPYRFSAVNGWELSLETINDVGVKYTKGMIGGFTATSYLTKDLEPVHSNISKYGQTYFVHCFARGTIGIILSHLSILKDAYDSGYETIWVMEDDIEVLRDPSQIPNMITKLDRTVGKGNWDMLFTDRDFRNHKGEYVPASGAAKRPNFNPKHPNNYRLRKAAGDFIQIGARFGATSVIYRRSGIKKLLDYFNRYQVFLPYDMDFQMPPGIKLYSVKRSIISNLANALSDNGAPWYERD